MKQINEVFTDEEFELLKKKKGTKTWHDFILELTQKSVDFRTKMRRYGELKKRYEELAKHE